MHQYQTDEGTKNNFLLLAVLLAVLFAYLFSLTIQYFELQLPWWIETPSILGFFGTIYWIYDKYLWKTKLIQNIEWIKTPDISGNWKVEIRTSHDGFGNTVLGKAIIRQSAFRISIALDIETSTSNSILVALLRSEKVSEFELIYTYVNYPKADTLETMSIHLGTTHVAISDNRLEMDGEYYTGRDRGNFGRIVFSRS